MKRSPLVRKTPLRRGPARTEKQKENRKASQLKKVGKRALRDGPKDRKAAKLCKELAFYTCQMQSHECWGQLEAAHRINRDDQKVRFDQRNLVCLCHYHHQIWAHNHIAEWEEWFDLHRPGVFHQLQITANHNGREAVE